uniref:Uncharacterized protein n=1 Tax=Panagrellus redivivus TaxID=6233 RepID=A0A7E4V1M7_PANRE
MSAVHTLIDPCQFPTPDSPVFPALCQLAYHEAPWLCDPSGLLSRTEAELLDGQLTARRRRNATSCFCLNNAPDDACGRHSQSDVIKFAVLLVPFSSLMSIDTCISNSPFSNALGLPSVKSYTLPAAALAYAREIAQRWSSHCAADVLLVYIQSWRPEYIRKPYLVRLFLNNLAHLSTNPAVHAIDSNTSPFTVISAYLREAISLAEAHPVAHHPNPGFDNYEQRHTHSWNSDPNSWGTVGGVPMWAVLLGSSLLILVIIAVHVANLVTTRLAVQRQLKKQPFSIRNHSAYRKTSNQHYHHAVAGGGKAHTKSTMMFRHFSGDRRCKSGPQKI